MVFTTEVLIGYYRMEAEVLKALITPMTAKSSVSSLLASLAIVIDDMTGLDEMK